MTAAPNSAAAKSAPALIVATGVHKDAHASLADGHTSVGASLDCDIAVTDLTARGAAFMLDYTNGCLSLTAASAPITFTSRRALARGKTLAPGQTVRLRSDVRFTVAGVTFKTLSAAKPPRPRSAFGSSKATLAIGIVAIGSLAFNHSASPVSTNIIAAAGPSAAGPSPDATPSAARSRQNAASAAGQNAASAVASLRRRLDAAGLSGVRLAAQPEGSVEAHGQVTPQQDVAWREAARWFDGAMGGRVVLDDQVRVVAEAPPLSVQAVWPGRSPYVIDGQGDKLFVGSILPTGWIITTIGDHRILVERAGQVLAVTF